MPFGIIAFTLTILCCLLYPEQVYAWGPGAHLVTGNWLLQNLSALPLEVASAIMHNPGQFLHGLLGADIFIGKGCRAKHGHSHNWESGFNLLERASDAPQQSYAYGYLSHLAADTVAHNVFVPGLIHTAPGRGKTAHIYLEAQADALIEWESSDALPLFTGQDSSAALSLLRSSMHKHPLPFWLSTRVYQGSIYIGGSKLWRGSMGLLDKILWEQDRSEQLMYLLRLSTRAMFNILQKGSTSQVLVLDPIGTVPLMHAEKKARQGRTLLVRGLCRQLLKTIDACRAPQKAIQLTSFLFHDQTTGNCPPMASFEADLPAVFKSLPAVCVRNKDMT